MRPFPAPAVVVTCALGATLLATGCAGGLQAANPSFVPARGADAATAPAGVRLDDLVPFGVDASAELYVSDEGANNAVEIFHARAPRKGPFASITSGISTPDGMAVDTSGNLYVSNAGNNTVEVFPPGASTPSKTYTNGLATPANVAVANDGTLFVVNLNGGTEFINEFPPGSMSPTLKIAAVGYANGIAVDPKGRLYASYHDSSGHGAVYRYPKGSTHGTDLNLAVHTPSGLVLDEKGDLIVADATLPAAIEVFPPGATSPSLSVTQGVGNPFLAALNHDETRYYVSDSYPSPAGVDVFTYPTLHYLYRITQGIAIPAGVALRPQAPL